MSGKAVSQNRAASEELIKSLGKDNVGAGETGGRNSSIAGEGYAPEEADQPP